MSKYFFTIFHGILQLVPSVPMYASYPYGMCKILWIIYNNIQFRVKDNMFIDNVRKLLITMTDKVPRSIG